MIQITPRYRRTLLFMAAFVMFSAALQSHISDFSFERSLMWREPWRWWTAHWVHLSWRHYVLNMLAFGFLALIFPHVYKRTLMWSLLIFSPLLSLGIYFGLPAVDGYAGLSGVLHSLYMFVAFQSLLIVRERVFACVVMSCATLKVGWEWFSGHAESAQFLQIPVLIEAHQIGYVIGLLAGVMYLIHWKWQQGTQVSIS